MDSPAEDRKEVLADARLAEKLKGVLPELSRSEKAKIKTRIKDYMNGNPGLYDAELIIDMKLLGMKRPEFIPREQWSRQQTELSPDDVRVCAMLANCVSTQDIVEDTGYTAKEIRNLLLSEIGKQKIADLQEKWFGGNIKKHMGVLAKKGVRVIEDILDSPTVKPQTKLNAATYTIDHEVGRPQQKIELQVNLLREVFDKMDALPKGNIIQPEFKKIEDGSTPAPSAFTIAKDEVDQWLEANP